jgi:hypothetical protein
VVVVVLSENAEADVAYYDAAGDEISSVFDGPPRPLPRVPAGNIPTVCSTEPVALVSNASDGVQRVCDNCEYYRFEPRSHLCNPRDEMCGGSQLCRPGPLPIACSAFECGSCPADSECECNSP